MTFLWLAVWGCGSPEFSAPDAVVSEETLSQSESTPSEQPSEGIGDSDEAESVAVALPSVVLPTRQATTPSPVVADPEIEAALRALKRIVAKETADPHNPWAIAHGLLALGDGHVLSNGQNAVEGLFENYAQKAITQGHPLIAFPQSATGPKGEKVRVEPHTDLIMKALAESGVRLDTRVQVEGEERQLGELYYDTVLSTYLDMNSGNSSFESPNDMPWGLQAIGTYAPADLEWVSAAGKQDLDTLTSFLVRVLTMESAQLFQWMHQGGTFQKNGQGIFKYTCGGSHLLQGAAYLVAKGFGEEKDRERLQAQVDLLFWRFPRELEVYSNAMERYPQQELLLVVQQLKFVGHWLESIHKMAAMGLFDPNPPQQIAMGEALRILVDTAKRLKKTGALDNLQTVREGNEQLYLDIVGDASHAVRGVELALGRASINY